MADFSRHLSSASLLNMALPEAEEAPSSGHKRPAARGTAFYPRKRANTACQVCRARKTKCDNLKPSCSYCLSVGATCIQSPVDLSAFDPASLKILERLDQLEKTVRETAGARLQNAGDCRQSPPGMGQVPSIGSSLEDIPLRSILPEKVESLRSWPAISGSSSRASPGDGRASSSHAFSPSSGSIGGLIDMEPHGLKALLDNFFLHVHCKNPIFDEKEMRRLVSKVILDGLDWSPASCLALIICALGSIATPLGPSLDTKPDSPASTEAWNLFSAAQKRIGALLCTTDIIGAQCLFLSGVYMMCIFKPFQAWRFFSQALAACQTLPFLQRAHKTTRSVAESPNEYMTMSPDETQQQAVYWSAWKSEREMRQYLVLPDFNMPHATGVSYPPFFPTPPQPLESGEGEDSERQRLSWLFYLAEISLRRLCSRVCDEVLDLHRSTGSNIAFLSRLAELLPDYEGQAQQWADGLPPELSLGGPPGMDNVCIYVLRGHLVNFFETIYWPFVMGHLACLERHSTAHLPGREFAGKGLYYHIKRIYVNEPGFLHRHHGTWPMIRGSIRSALILLGAGALGSDMPVGWQDAANQVAQLVSLWEDEDAELCEWRDLLQHVISSLDAEKYAA